MLFPSIIFLFCFLPVMLVLYYGLCRKSMQLKNLVLFIGSIAFYAYGEGFGTLLLLTSIVMNWGAGMLLERYQREPKRAKTVMILAVILNLSLLFFYKYLDFVIASLNRFGHFNLQQTKVSLPIGISFFTFQAVSYVVDVYRKKAQAQKNPVLVGLYIALFPQLIAGPIVRYDSIALQMKERRETLDQFGQGVIRLITGIGKKILLADSMALFADRIFQTQGAGTALSVSYAWLGAIAYTLQIYYDFSGYSDMAIGLGKMFGFTFEENFNYPYISRSVTEFWRRWHISLSTWFRDYVYIPLGGNRKSKKRTYLNLFLVWLLTGIWHGAGFTFLLWGMLYFVILIFEKSIGLGKKWSLPPVIANIYTMVVVIVGWTIFKSGSLTQALSYLCNMIGIHANGLVDQTTLFYLRDNWMIFVAALVLVTPVGKYLEQKRVLYQLGLALVMIISLIYIIKGNYSPFIYFSF